MFLVAIYLVLKVTSEVLLVYTRMEHPLRVAADWKAA